MPGLFMVAVLGITSVGAYLFSRKCLGISGRNLGAAASKMLESLGVTLVFCAANLALAVTLILIVRGSTGTFISLYHAGDVVWLGLSILQGLTFQWWSEGFSGKPDRRH